MGNEHGTLGGGKLTKKDIERIQRRFLKLANGRSELPISSFQDIAELGSNPLIPRIFQLFDTDKDNTLTIAEFTKALEYFGQLEGLDQQYEFAFRIYDLDGDGFISPQELYKVLEMLMGSTYGEAQLEQVVMNTIQEFDSDHDGKLCVEEFKKLLTPHDLQQKFSMPL